MSQYPPQLNPMMSPTGPGGPAGLSGAMAQAEKASQSPPEREPIEKGFDLLQRMEPGTEAIAIEYSAASIAVSLRQISLDLRALVNLVREGNIGQGVNLSKIADHLNSGNAQLTNVRGAIDSVAKAKREALQNELSKLY